MRKNISLLMLLTIISLLFVGCGREESKLKGAKTYSNDYYSIKYPSNWSESKEDEKVIFSDENEEIVLSVRKQNSPKNYFEIVMEKVKKEVDVEDCVVSKNKAYKLQRTDKIEGKVLTAYVVKEKDVFFEIAFICAEDKQEEYKSLMGEIINSFELKDFLTFDELNQSPIVDGDRDAKWLADIEFVEENLPKYHKNLFFDLKKEDFSNNIEDIKKKISTSTNEEMLVEMSKLIATVGDAHTTFFGGSKKLYPLEFYYFEDGLYLIDSSSEYENYIGMKLKAINDKSFEEIEELFRFVLSYESEPWFKREFAKEIINKNYLDGMKITDFKPTNFSFVDENNNEKKVEVKTDRGSLKNGVRDKDEKMLYQKNRGQNYWYEYLKDEKTVYFNYNFCIDMENQPLLDFTTELFEFVDSNEVDKIVVDMRNNTGGSSNLLDLFFYEILKREDLNRKNKLFVVVGRDTYSSAVLNIVDFENKTNATIIGEPSGGKPNHHGQVQIMELRNTDTFVGYSTKYFEHSSNKSNSVIPEVLVEPKAENYFNNIDEVMEIILNTK